MLRHGLVVAIRQANKLSADPEFSIGGVQRLAFGGSPMDRCSASKPSIEAQVAADEEHVQPEGEPFKYSGVIFDCKLTVADEISRITQKARAKVTAILRIRNYYSVKELVQQYK